eukprot:scaffold174284_cov21-Tisochrysis_lutea.AAC.1
MVLVLVLRMLPPCERASICYVVVDDSSGDLVVAIHDGLYNLVAVDDSDVNLGLTQHSGLRPFEPHLPKAVDPLWTVGASEEAKPRQQRAVRWD